MKARLPYLALMHLIIFMWGFTGILGKLIHLEAFTLVWARILIATLSLGIVIVLFKIPLKIKGRRLKLWVATGGVFVALHWITFYTSIQLSTASLGILCLSTATIHVTWLEPLILKTKFSWSQMAMASVIVIGIWLVSRDLDFKQTQALGFGLFSALCAALFTVINAKVSEDVKTPTLAFYEFSVGLIFVSILIPFVTEFDLRVFHLPMGELGWLLFLAIGCTTFAFLATIEVVKVLGVFTVSLSINLEPVYTIILAVVMLGEDAFLNTDFYVGTAIILAAVLVNGLLKNRQSRLAKKSIQVSD
jgi:drug/metabolite transporter (DMT)-like permease